MKIVAVADTHGQYKDVKYPEGDVLIFAGDILNRGCLNELRGFNAFLKELDYERVYVVPGNHDICFKEQLTLCHQVLFRAELLIDDLTSYKGKLIYGSPWTQALIPGWIMHFAYVKDKEDLWGVFNKIPENLDILITHGPPWGILDKTAGWNPENAGSRALRIITDNKVPKIHIFGHIHEAYGSLELPSGRVCYNVSALNRNYKMTNEPIVIEIGEEGE